VSESVTYLDVGLKLDVEPTIHLDNQVAIRVALEVSSIAKEIPLRSGLAYQLGTRSASSVLRLRDGETQFLAGLISADERSSASRLPGLGDLPVLGRLFSSQRDSSEKTEIILSITPRIVRPLSRPPFELTEFFSGTEASLRSRPPQASGAADANKPGAGSVGNQAPAGGAPVAGGASGAVPAAAPAAAADRSVRLAFEGPAAAKVGQEVAVVLRLTSSTPVRGLPLQLGFDPQAVDVVAVDEGRFFGRDGSPTNFSHSVDATAGRISIATIRSAASGLQGGEEVLTIRLRPRKAGRTDVAVLSARLVGPDGDAQLVLPGPWRLEVQ
jgi:general secretion pathway protein D